MINGLGIIAKDGMEEVITDDVQQPIEDRKDARLDKHVNKESKQPTVLI